MVKFIILVLCSLFSVCDLPACLSSDIEWRGLECDTRTTNKTTIIILAQSKLAMVLIIVSCCLIVICCSCVMMIRLCYVRNYRFTRYWNNVCQPVVDDCCCTCCCCRTIQPPPPIEMDAMQRAGILLNESLIADSLRVTTSACRMPLLPEQYFPYEYASSFTSYVVSIVLQPSSFIF